MPDRTPPRRAATLKDVAALAGVNASTASRALQRPERVSDATRQRIEQAARELDYVPSMSGYSLRTSRSRIVSLVVADVTNPFYFALIRGTQHRLRDAGYHQVLIDTDESQENEARTLRALRSISDGAIVVASRLSDAELTETARDMPLVALNRRLTDVSTVTLDSGLGVREAVRHLAELGHRRIAYAAGPVSSWSDAQRWSAVEESGRLLGVDVVRIGPFPPNADAGDAAATAAIDAGVSACIAFNDLLAIGMLECFRRRGVTVPAELSVIGIDDIYAARTCNPPLTTVAAPIEEAGRAAVTAMLAILDGIATPTSTVLPTSLTIRESTAAAAG